MIGSAEQTTHLFPSTGKWNQKGPTARDLTWSDPEVKAKSPTLHLTAEKGELFTGPHDVFLPQDVPRSAPACLTTLPSHLFPFTDLTFNYTNAWLCHGLVLWAKLHTVCGSLATGDSTVGLTPAQLLVSSEVLIRLSFGVDTEIKKKRDQEALAPAAHFRHVRHIHL